VQPEGEGFEVAVSNDTDVAWTGALRLTRRRFDGEVLAEVTVDVDVAARSTVRVPVEASVGTAGDVASECVVADLGDERGLWFFAEFRDSALLAADLETEARRVDGGVQVVVTARSLVRELSLLADVAAPDAEVDEMLVTLLPGERAVFTIRTGSDVDPSRFLSPDVLRSANALLINRKAEVTA